MASSLPIRLHPPLVSRRQKTPSKSCFPTSFQLRKNPSFTLKPPIFASQSSSEPTPSSSWEREEIRWLREEQRWIREEQRWIREEQRWSSERESLLREIAALKLHIEALEREKPSISEAVVNLDAILRGRIVAPSPQPVLAEQAEVKEMILEEIRVPESREEKKEEGKKKRKTLRKGSEGDDVRTMQEALQRWGFYSGEEDMEYSSFSSGTERAVKTWQASLGTLEDGIMTAELLEKLFMEQGIEDASIKVNADQKKYFSAAGRVGTNGAPVASVTEMAEIHQTIIKESGDAEVEVSQNRVFLLGENRWEEPSRLVDRNKPTGGSKAATKCLSCRGEGRIMCTECDGTGEPNIEPQFMEWVDEGSKCPYCEGLGYTICDVCEGIATA